MKVSHKKQHDFSAAAHIQRLLLAWLGAALLEFLLLPRALRPLASLSGIAAMHPVRLVLIAAAVFVLLMLSAKKRRAVTAERWGIAGCAGLLCIVSVTSSYTPAFFSACFLVCGLLSVYALYGWDGSDVTLTVPHRTHSPWIWAAAAGAIAFFLLVSVWTVCRVRAFSAPTYDFGIFSQMFHSMKTTGLPMTTVERDGPLSHFAVHVSPIYYLLLPFYALVPRPETLQVMQAAVLASAVIPLWKLGRLHGLKPSLCATACGVLLLYPAYAGGASYDIHENAFLTPLILWLFYGLDRKSITLTAVFGILTLMVKEDAAVYVAVIALYVLLRGILHKGRKWDIVAGGVLLAGSLVWFGAVTHYLASSGDGVMTYRYKNFMFDGSDSLTTVVKAVLLCPAKAVFECVDAEKLPFLALTMLPLALLPLLTRRYERYVLLIPYLLVNLMSDYRYQHDIFFQYTYGATACLVYMTVVNVADLRAETHRLAALLAALLIGAGCFAAKILPVALRYPEQCVTYAAHYDKLRDTLDTVPDGASVASTTFYTAYLSRRDTLYDVRYASQEHLMSCEYVVLGVTDSGSYKKYAADGKNGFENLTALLLENGYTRIAAYEGKLEIYQKQP